MGFIHSSKLRKAINRVVYLVKTNNVPIHTAIKLVSQETRIAKECMREEDVLEWDRLIQAEDLMKKNICPCCKEDTLLPVWKREFGIGECMRCR